MFGLLGETHISLVKHCLMRYYFDAAEFSKKIKYKRLIELNTGLREVAKSTKVSPATISRIENKKTPEMDSFLKMCHWLNADPSNFWTPVNPAKKSNNITNAKQK